MTDSGAVETLFSAGVLTTGDGGATTSEGFDAAPEEYAAEVRTAPDDRVETLVRERVDREVAVDALVELGREDPRTVAELCATAEVTDAAEDDLLALLPTLRLFRPEAEPTAGVPDAFIPVQGSHVSPLSRVYATSLVYVWLDDCPPCDTVREDLDAIFAEPRGVMPFAVYGPAHEAVLAEEYDLNAGPALLFLREGRVETRLYGAQPRGAVENELSKLERGAEGKP